MYPMATSDALVCMSLLRTDGTASLTPVPDAIVCSTVFVLLDLYHQEQTHCSDDLIFVGSKYQCLVAEFNTHMKLFIN